MKIAVNTLSIRPGKVGGGETYLYHLLESLNRQREGDTLALIVSPDNRVAFEERLPGAEFVDTGVASAHRLRRVAFEQFRLAALVKRIGADVLFCPGNTGIRNPPCPMVVVVQSLLTHLLPKEAGTLRSLYFRTTLRSAVRDASILVAVSHDIANELARLAPAAKDKTRVIHEGLDRGFGPVTDENARCTVLSRYGIGGPFVLYVSSFKPYKNPDKAIAAFGLAAKRLGATHRLVMVGRDLGGMRPALDAEAKRSGIEDLVVFTGPVPRDDLRALYTAADVFLFPSALESFGIPPLEAFACGTPVIASNRSAVGEVVGEGGLRFDPSDVYGMADGIVRLIGDEAFRQQTIAAGKERLNDFDWDIAGRETLAVLREAAATKSGA